MSTTEWFYAGADEHVGPFSSVQMAALVRSGAVASDALVWREGMESWVPAGQAFPPRATPPPVPGRGLDTPFVPQPATSVLATSVPDAGSSQTEPLPDVSAAARVLKKRAVTVTAVLMAFAAWQVFDDSFEGNVFGLSALVTLAGTTQFRRAPMRGRWLVLVGSAVAGLITLLVFMDSLEDLSPNDLERFAPFLLVASVFQVLLVLKKSDFRAKDDSELAPDSPWRSWDDVSALPGTTQAASAPLPAGGPTADAGLSVASEVASIPAEVNQVGDDRAKAARISSMPQLEALLASGVTSADAEDDAHESAPSAPLAPVELLRLPTTTAVYESDIEDDKRAWWPQAGATFLILAVLLLAGWVGLGAYERAQAAQARVDAVARAVGAVAGTDIDRALQAGQAATDALGESSRLADAFGPQGAEQVRRLASAYAAYAQVSASSLRQNVETTRSELTRLESQGASARSEFEELDRRAFFLGRRFDTATSGAGMYEGLDIATSRKVVLKIGGDAAEQIGPGQQAVLYVESEGEEAITVRQSNAYQSFDTTEYYTVYRVEGSVEQVEALVRQIESDARSVRVSLSEIEAHLNTAVGIARDDYWASVGPVIASLQERD